MNKFEEAESGDGIESRAGFIEDEQGWLGDERSGDEDALAFALGEDVPGAIGEVGGFDLGKEIEGEADLVRARLVSEPEDGRKATEHGDEGGFVVGDVGADTGGDEADAGSEFSPVAFAEGLAEH